MANAGAPLLLFTLLLLLASTITQTLSLSSSITNKDLQLFDWMTTSSTNTRSTCQGTLSDCLTDEFEFDLDSESNRRILATSYYISYGALNRNRVPCSRRGASYYNCHGGGQANPYRRGCSAITRCRSW